MCVEGELNIAIIKKKADLINCTSSLHVSMEKCVGGEVGGRGSGRAHYHVWDWGIGRRGGANTAVGG